jgi:pyruvate dehydrogenase E1 component alpha subunit/2-oxoisovalerate dehydrogenase E1 component alpha subunit
VSPAGGGAARAAGRGPARRTAEPREAPLDREQRLRLYRHLRANRLLEERLSALYRQGRITGGLYRSLGQEATSVGSAFALGPRDVLAPMIRNLGSLLVRGVRARDLFAQYMARGGSPTGGKDNVVHFGTVDGRGHFTLDERGGIVSCISPLGNLVAVLAGIALGARMRGLDTVCLTYVGDGATSTGEFHEGMSLACARRLPVVVVIENNRWAYSTPVEKQTLLASLAERAVAYGCPGETVDGQDVEAVYAATRRAVERARAGGGPSLIEAKTYRMKGHAEHDDQRYVPREELEEWGRRDPLALYARALVAGGHASERDLQKVDAEVAAEVDAELAEAMAMGPPEPHTALEGTYADPHMDAWARRSKLGGLLALE